MKRNSVAIIGTGYVGLTSAACLAHLGNSVVAIDIDQAKVESLTRGDIGILELGLEELVHEGVAEGRLEFSTSFEDAGLADVVLLCLPTPATDAGGLDLSYVESAVQTLSPLLRPGSVVVTKSTVPVGTHRLVVEWLDRTDVDVAANPEFLREGSAVQDFLHPDRIIIGAATASAADCVAQMYAAVDAPIHMTDPASAELVKYAANTFLATKLSFVNELSRLCDSVGGRIDAVLDGIAADHRIGASHLSPGPGWGGSCFPKDTRGMEHIAALHGVDLPVVKAAAASNAVHFEHMHRQVELLCEGSVQGSKLAIWGATFKAGTDDCRDSPAIAIMDRLVASGAQLRLYDPAARPEINGVTSVDDLYSACYGADLLVVLTEWDEFGKADMNQVASELAGTAVYDTRSVIDSTEALAAGLTVHRPGQPTGW